MGSTCSAHVGVPFTPAPTGADATAGIVILALLGFGFVITVSSFITQLREPAPYGKFAEDGAKTAKEASDHAVVNAQPEHERSLSEDARTPENAEERKHDAAGDTVEDEAPPACSINQRIAHTLSDFPSGVLGVTLIYVLVPGRAGGDSRTVSSGLLLAAWLLHYIHRGLIHPWVMPYGSKTTPLGICIGGMIPNWTFCSALALHLAYAGYPPGYLCDVRFIAGALIFVAGYVMNRWADLHLRSIRLESQARGGPKYVVPRAGPFRLVCNANYLGELIQWIGFALMSSSAVAVLWVVFCLSTFLPRSVRTLDWYKNSGKFDAAEIPAGWCAVIPFIL